MTLFDIKRNIFLKLHQIIARMSDTKITNKPITLRLHPEVRAKLQAAAEASQWSLNDEINFRLRAEPILDQLKALTAEVEKLKKRLPPGD